MSRQMLLNVIASLGKEISRDLTKDLSASQTAHYTAYIKKLFEHTMSDGKCARSQLVLKTYQALVPTTSQDELLGVAKVAGTVELLQSFFLIVDDVIDHSKLRRGKPCWYTMDGVGLTAILDGLFMDKAIDLVIHQAIPSHPRKFSVLQLISETNRKTLMGQRLDCDTTVLQDFSWERYKEIVEHKTSHYTYYLPLSMAFQLADVQTNLLALKPIAYKLGYLFQAQDDYLDCFEDPVVTGKSSNDLAERKCTWITCKYLETLQSSSNQQHLQLFSQHFGRPEKEHIEAAKQMILDTGVKQDFLHFQKGIAQELHEDIAQFPMPQVRAILDNCVHEIVGRRK